MWGCSGSGVSKLQSGSQNCLSCCCQIFLEPSQAHCLHVVSGSFCTTTTELSSFNRDHMTGKGEILTICVHAMLSHFQFSSVTQSCPTLCDHMNRSTPGLPVHHHLPEFTQTHIHQVSDAIQPSHPLSSPSPPDPNPSQHQSLFQ